MQEENHQAQAHLLDCWQRIALGTTSRKSNYHIMGFHYMAANLPRSVNVIPRTFCPETHTLNIHTDQRSSKITHLQTAPEISGLFWCRIEKVQLSINATAHVQYHNDITQKAWSQMNAMSKVCYCADFPPGTPTDASHNGFTQEGWKNRHMNAETTEPYQHFAIIQLQIHSIERLHLSANGHDRILFNKDPETNQWTHQWLTP